MRVYKDEEGRSWDAVVGRESWGAVVLIFVAREGSDPPRQTLMSVRSPEEGNRELKGMTEKELGDLFEGSAAKPTA